MKKNKFPNKIRLPRKIKKEIKKAFGPGAYYVRRSIFYKKAIQEFKECYINKMKKFGILKNANDIVSEESIRELLDICLEHERFQINQDRSDRRFLRTTISLSVH